MKNIKYNQPDEKSTIERFGRPDDSVKVECVDLFCGAGGLTHGLQKSGILVKAGIDFNESCRFPFEANNKPAKFYAADVAALDGEILKEMYSGSAIKLLAGCAPCQPFSSYSLNKTDDKDKRWSLLTEFTRLVDELRPELVTMENVPQLEKHAVFKTFQEQLIRLRFHISYQLIDCRLYGVPQSRKRLVLLASQLGPIDLRRPNSRIDKARTVKQTIGKLPKLSAGEIDTSDPLHRASRVTPINMKRLRTSNPGGSWRDWSPHLIAKCHRNKKGKSFAAVYGRMQWNLPSPTITTQFYGFGNGRFGHPEQDRALSLREGAMLQTFPRDYRFAPPDGPVHFTTVGEMIGNAVPVRLGEVIGQSVASHVRKSSKASRGRKLR